MIILFGKRLCDRMLNTEWSNPVRREVERDLRRWLVVSPWSRWAPESSWCHTAWPAACRWSSQSPRQTNLCRRRSAPTPRAPCRTWYSCERLQVNTENRLRKKHQQSVNILIFSLCCFTSQFILWQRTHSPVAFDTRKVTERTSGHRVIQTLRMSHVRKTVEAF